MEDRVPATTVPVRRSRVWIHVGQMGVVRIILTSITTHFSLRAQIQLVVRRRDERSFESIIRQEGRAHPGTASKSENSPVAHSGSRLTTKFHTSDAVCLPGSILDSTTAHKLRGS